MHGTTILADSVFNNALSIISQAGNRFIDAMKPTQGLVPQARAT